MHKWEEAHIATFSPSKWCIGDATLRMTPPFVTDIASFYTPMQIAHRGLTKGPSHELENNKETLISRCSDGYYSECDIWKIDGSFYLGHDEPITPISLEELCTPYLWIHAKNKDAFESLVAIRNTRGIDLRIFWHTDEDYILTTHGDCIVYPGKPLLAQSVFMMPELAGKIEQLETCSGVCSDYISNYHLT
jgi:hypothetical protein